MKKDEILVVGYFGFENNQLDGQTIKTRNVYNLLRNKNKNCKYFDTQSVHSKFLRIFELFFLTYKFDKLVYLPGKNSLYFFFPILFIIAKLKKNQIILIAIGGWLSEFVRDHCFHKMILKRIKIILVENYDLKISLLENSGFRNVEIMRNFRLHEFIPKFRESKDDLKLVFMARVTKLKGIDVICEIARNIDLKYKNKNIVIDVFGPINPPEKKEFLELIDDLVCLNYKGLVEPEMVYKTLQEYDVLILPTRYPGEGFPGSILDAYISGIPVIVSNWKYLPEFVDQGRTGYVLGFNDMIEVLDLILNLYSNNILLQKLKIYSYEESKKYSSNAAWNQLSEYL